MGCSKRVGDKTLPMHTQLFAELELAGIAYCLLRDADRLDELAEGGEVDLLVRAGQFAELRHLLQRLGFARMPDRGYAPHHFFINYDPSSDCWLKLDVVTEIAYGRPVKNLPTDLAEDCIRTRQSSGPTYIPSPETEFITLLLHCLLDKPDFEPHRQARLQTLCHQITNEDYMTEQLAKYWLPDVRWKQIAEQVESGNWSDLRLNRPAVIAHLMRRDPFGVRIRTFRSKALRQFNKYGALLRPTVPTVALLGPDGAGKSTLAQSIQATSYFPARQVYMGLYQKKTEQSRASHLPGLGFIQLLLTQWQRYLSARLLQARGNLVIFDRYPYDSRLSLSKKLSWPKKLRRWLLAHACPSPDLVLILDAPAETLFARKGEHTVPLLERQRQSYLKLQASLPQASVLDTTTGIEQLRRNAIALIWQFYADRHSHH